MKTILENNHIAWQFGEIVKLDMMVADKKTVLSEHLKEQFELLKAEEEILDRAHLKLENEWAKHSERINFNVGGMLFSTTKQTLTRIPNTYFTAMLSSEIFKPDADGYYFLDRDPSHFGRIINYLRSGFMDKYFLNESEIEQLNADLDYFCIENLDTNIIIWNSYKKSDYYHISADCRTAKLARSSNQKCTVIARQKVDIFKLKLNDIHYPIWIGFTAETDWYPNGCNVKNGWFIQFFPRDYRQGAVNGNEVITLIREGTNIKVKVDEIDKGIYYTNVPDQKLYPAAQIKTAGQSVTLL